MFLTETILVLFKIKGKTIKVYQRIMHFLSVNVVNVADLVANVVLFNFTALIYASLAVPRVQDLE